MTNAIKKQAAQPFVSVVTPVYNGENYLAECIESVLSQTHSNFEYVIVDNCCTDRSLKIAQSYARQDGRIKIVQNEQFLDQVSNHNHALKNISRNSDYCKIVAADDKLFPNCIETMVRLAESGQNIGVVGAYTLLDWGNRTSVYLAGLPYKDTVFWGKDICRRFLIEGLYVFGPPTATLLRSEIVHQRNPFYPEDSVTEDVDIFFEILPSWNFGFVHEILTYTRRSNESTISSVRYGLMELTRLVEIAKYGKLFLSRNEYRRYFRKIRNDYLLVLGNGALKFKQNELWEFHKRGLKSCGINLGFRELGIGVLYALTDLIFNPKRSLDLLIRKLLTRQSNSRL
jgi:glycosyltransferase involved in cell wall biosynthesis